MIEKIPYNDIMPSVKSVDEIMNKYKFINLAVFIIFFGTALFNAFQKQNWIEVILFLALGVISLWADFKTGKSV